MKVVIVFNTVARGDVFIYGVSTCMDITSAQVFGINVYCEFSFGVLGQQFFWRELFIEAGKSASTMFT